LWASVGRLFEGMVGVLMSWGAFRKVVWGRAARLVGGCVSALRGRGWVGWCGGGVGGVGDGWGGAGEEEGGGRFWGLRDHERLGGGG